jgi:hypothetical protein
VESGRSQTPIERGGRSSSSTRCDPRSMVNCLSEEQPRKQSPSMTSADAGTRDRSRSLRWQPQAAPHQISGNATLDSGKIWSRLIFEETSEDHLKSRLESLEECIRARGS